MKRALKMSPMKPTKVKNESGFGRQGTREEACSGFVRQGTREEDCSGYVMQGTREVWSGFE